VNAAPIELLESRPARRSTGETAGLVALALALQVLVWGLMVFLFAVHHVWYGFHDISDTALYYDYAQRMAGGLRPYLDFPLEYPPLALPLLTLPGHLVSLTQYQEWFSGEMIALCAAAAAVTTAAATHLWRGVARPAAVATVFAAATLLTGAIVANRYDIAVALTVAAFLVFAARRWWIAAAAALGLGFALKLTPLLLLPLLFGLAATRRRVVWAAIAFGVAALLPFVPFLLVGGHGLTYVFTYNAHRPLQIESMLSTPYLIGSALGLTHAVVGNSYGSQFISAPGAHALATLSPWLSLAALALVYGLAWRRRFWLRATPAALPLVGLAVVLAFICTSKVLSPQYMIWTIPLVALVAVSAERGHRTLGALTLVAMLVTQIEFPSHYWQFVALERWPMVLVALRNVLLLAAGVLAAVLVWQLPAADTPAERAAVAEQAVT
jgi:hypothetical protein